MEMGEFHWRDGTYFKRLENGSVRVRRTETPNADSPTALTLVIPPSEWASIIAHVSSRGETAESYCEAEKFHG